MLRWGNTERKKFKTPIYIKIYPLNGVLSVQKC